MTSGNDPPSDEMRRSKSGRSRLVMVLFLLLSLGAITAIWLSMREYRSVVTMEYRYESHEHPPLPGSDGWIIGIIGFQGVLRQLDEILRPVIEQFDLTRALAPHGRTLSFRETKDRLSESIEVRGIPDTGLLEVSVYLRNPQLASDIANAIVEKYGEERVKESRASTDRALAQIADEIELQRTRVERARQEMTESKERGGMIDPDPENPNSVLNKVGADQNAINNYATAKARFLADKRILEAGELKLRVEKQDAPNYKFEPVKIWKRADASQHRPHMDLQRIWTHHKLQCILSLIASVALLGLSIVAAIILVVKLLQQTSPPLPGQENHGHDTTTYDY